MPEITPKRPKKFKPVNIAAQDFSEYTQDAKDMTAKLGMKVSVPSFIRRCVSLCKQHGLI